MRSFVYYVCRAIARVFLGMFGGYRVTGAENIPSKGPCLIAANHESYLDPCAIGIATRRRLRYMAGAVIFEIPVLRSLARALGAFPVHPDMADRTAIRETERLLGMGEAIVIFPEGQTSRVGHLLPFHSGALLIALRSGAPVIPAAITGAARRLPPDTWVPHRVRVEVRFGKTLNLTDLASWPHRRQALDEATRRLEEAVRELLNASTTSEALCTSGTDSAPVRNGECSQV